MEKFEASKDIDKIVIVCRNGYLDYMDSLVKLYNISKVQKIVLGGAERQNSLIRGINAAKALGAKDDVVVVIHDGVRPLVSELTIHENVRVAKECGCAITVHSVTESVVILSDDNIKIDNFKKRSDTYSLSAPQSFRIGLLLQAFDAGIEEHDGMPLLDAGMVFSACGGNVQLVKEQTPNIKITTPEDFYYLKAMLELEENKFVFGL